MKGRILLVLLSLAFVSLSFAGDKGDGKASCCQAGTKASLTSNTKVKDCPMPCTEAMKAQCPYMKGTKASVKKASMKIAGRSNPATKATEAKVVKVKQESPSPSGKGTD